MSNIPEVSIIIPCFNEEAGLGNLKMQLLPELHKLSARWELIFVDDGSTDNTLPLLRSLFESIPNTKITAHEKNKNLGAAIRTGANAAVADILIFLDSDCTYAPSILLPLLESVKAGADLATASPYHPAGRVDGVPKWRLALSLGLSTIYQILLQSNIHTFTAMVRAMRRDCFWKSATNTNDFSFTAEQIVRAKLLGFKISEVPAVLTVRKFGYSKIKLWRTIVKHLLLITRILFHTASLNKPLEKSKL